ncbi:hypothetical protein Tco_1002799 [Tanacetum coccineum]|uniref:Uncharacterized protein n=1 Tax=Tanacetum coccineum TaxID=301880 RepID=A0ABQ5F7A4_9ASTR
MYMKGFCGYQLQPYEYEVLMLFSNHKLHHSHSLEPSVSTAPISIYSGEPSAVVFTSAPILLLKWDQEMGNRVWSCEMRVSNSVLTKRSRFSMKEVGESFGRRDMWRRVMKSIKIALLSDKINLLIPCGPLAMLVDH